MIARFAWLARNIAAKRRARARTLATAGEERPKVSRFLAPTTVGADDSHSHARGPSAGQNGGVHLIRRRGPPGVADFKSALAAFLQIAGFALAWLARGARRRFPLHSPMARRGSRISRRPAFRMRRELALARPRPAREARRRIPFDVPWPVVGRGFPIGPPRNVKRERILTHTPNARPWGEAADIFPFADGPLLIAMFESALYDFCTRTPAGRPGGQAVDPKNKTNKKHAQTNKKNR